MCKRKDIMKTESRTREKKAHVELHGIAIFPSIYPSIRFYLIAFRRIAQIEGGEREENDSKASYAIHDATHLT